jgi:hypothetical protein
VEYVNHTGQKYLPNLRQGMAQDRKDAVHAKFSWTGMTKDVRVAESL